MAPKKRTLNWTILALGTAICLTRLPAMAEYGDDDGGRYYQEEERGGGGYDQGYDEQNGDDIGGEDSDRMEGGEGDDEVGGPALKEGDVVMFEKWIGPDKTQVFARGRVLSINTKNPVQFEKLYGYGHDRDNLGEIVIETDIMTHAKPTFRTERIDLGQLRNEFSSIKEDDVLGAFFKKIKNPDKDADKLRAVAAYAQDEGFKGFAKYFVEKADDILLNQMRERDVKVDRVIQEIEKAKEASRDELEQKLALVALGKFYSKSLATDSPFRTKKILHILGYRVASVVQRAGNGYVIGRKLRWIQGDNKDNGYVLQGGSMIDQKDAYVCRERAKKDLSDAIADFDKASRLPREAQNEIEKTRSKKEEAMMCFERAGIVEPEDLGITEPE